MQWSLGAEPASQICLEGNFRHVVSPDKKRQKDTQIEPRSSQQANR